MATLQEICHEMHAKVEAMLACDPSDPSSCPGLAAVQRQTRTSLSIITDALQRYSFNDLSLSYNGGKDCLVLLVLLLAAMHTRFTLKSSTATPESFPSRLPAIYIECADPFPAVDSFVNKTAVQYHLALSRSRKPMKAALADHLARHPQLRAIFVGTRRTDPHGGCLTYFDETDGDWPRFMRVHPVIDWHYTEIWGFIQGVRVEYCELYDRGYTSLGGQGDTHPNPALRRNDGEGFRPAYELTEDLEERLGRVR